MYKDGDKVKLKNGNIVTISGLANSLDMTEAYKTYENVIITLEMIQEKVN